MGDGVAVAGPAHMKIDPGSPCIWTRGMDRIELPVRHGEGKFHTDDGTMDRLMGGGQVVAQYARPDNTPAEGEYPFNPNGSPHDIGAICDPKGRILGIMPHPEGYLHFTNHPGWTREREKLKRGNLPIPEEGDGIRLFTNAVEYAKENLSGV